MDKQQKIGKQKASLEMRHLDVSAIAKNTAKTILVLAAAGALISLAMVAPNFPSALAKLGTAFGKASRSRRWRAIRRLEKRRLIEIRERGSETIIMLTELGRQQVVRFDLDCLQIGQPERWDGKWRIIVFDIPEKFQRGRRALRMKLQELGFYPFQKSVFVHPYPCKEEVDFVADFFGLGRYLNYIEATHVDDEDYLKEHFKLA